MTEERETLSRIESLLRHHPKGLTTSAITRHLKRNRNSTAKYLEVLTSSGIAECKQVGASKVYTLSKRISLKSLMNYTSEYILVLDSSQKILNVNESLLRFFGVSREAIEGKYIEEVPVDLIRSLTDSNRIIDQERELITELSSVVAGNLCHFQVRCLPTVFEDRDSGFTILIDDISGQKRYEQQLARSEAKYRAVIEAQTDLIFRRRPDGTVTFVNNEFLRFFKKNAGDVEGSKFCPHDLRLQTGREPADSSLAILPFYKDQYEQCVLLDNGEIRWLQWKNSSIYDPAGTVTEIQSVGRDVTVQRQREREILLKRCSTESSPHAIAIFDLVGRIVYANRPFKDLFRCPEDFNIVGEPLERFSPPAGAGSNINQMSRTLVETGSVDCLIRGKRFDNTDVDLEFHATLIRHDLHFPLNSIVFLIDLTGAGPHAVTPAANATLPDPSAPVCGTLLIDPAGRLVTANRKFLALAGYNREHQLLGRPAADFIHPETESADALYSPAGNRKTRKTGDFCGQILNRDGTRVPVKIQVRHIHDAAGSHLCSQVMAQPSGSLTKLNVDPLGDLLPVPLFVTNRQKKVLWWNAAMEAFTGIRRAEIVGTTDYRKAFYPFIGVQPLLIDIVAEPLEKIRQTYPEARKYGDTIMLERYITDSQKSGGMYIYEKASLLFAPTGEVVGYMGGVMDITEWKRSQEFMDRMKDEIEESLAPRIAHLVERTGILFGSG